MVDGGRESATGKLAGSLETMLRNFKEVSSTPREREREREHCRVGTAVSHLVECGSSQCVGHLVAGDRDGPSWSGTVASLTGDRDGPW